MPKLLVLQHVAYEILGTLDPLLRRSGFRIRYVNFGRHPEARPTLEGYAGLVLLGGPMNVDETDRYSHLAHERDLVGRALDRNLPVLGICLGAQLIARALGAPVGRSPQKEVGWHGVSLTEQGREDPLFAHFDGAERLFQWHEDSFAIPSEAAHLARSEGCANQAFRFGRSVYGLQFHLEIDEPMVERWLGVPALQRDLEHVEGGAERLRSETRAHIARLQTLADRTFGAFVELFPQPAKTRILPSR